MDIHAEHTSSTDNVPVSVLILQAAIRRFSWFGIGKTTMTEIADDLSIPRHAIAQYFTDKGSLIAAVEKKIAEEYIHRLSQAFTTCSGLREGLLALVTIRQEYFEKHYRFILQGEPADTGKWSPVVTRALDTIREHEQGTLSGFLSGYTAEPHRHAALVLAALTAFEQAFKSCIPLPEETDFSQLISRELELIELIIPGLTASAAGSESAHK